MRKKIFISLIFTAVILAGCSKVEEKVVIPTNTPTCIPTVVDAAENLQLSLQIMQKLQ